MTKELLTFTASAICAAALALAAAGCGHAPNHERAAKAKADTADPFFQSENDVRQFDKFARASAAAGAAEDGTLYPSDFTAGRLNSAGREKLDLMLAGHHGSEPLVVYLSVPEKDAMTAARRDAVQSHVNASGASVAKLDLRLGANPTLYTPAAPAMANLHKTDSEYVSPNAAANGGGYTATGGSMSGTSTTH
jgi:hypothetical protein